MYLCKSPVGEDLCFREIDRQGVCVEIYLYQIRNNMKIKVFILSALLMLMFGCKPRSADEGGNIIDKQNLTIENGLLSPEALWALGRINEVSLSPDKTTLLFTITYYSVEENKGNADIYTIKTDGSDLKRITHTSGSEYSPVWHPDGDRIGFIAAGENGTQIYEVNLEGKGKHQISNVDGDLEGFSYSPDGSHILYIQTIDRKDKYAYLKKGLDKTTGRINDDLGYRHWDQWVDAYPHPFVAPVIDKKIGEGIDLLKGTEFESPMRPWGGMEQLAWSPDGKYIAYTCRKKVGKEYAESTNSDIYLYNIETKDVRNLSEHMQGYDQNPVFSHNGEFIAWESMERDGYEADKIRLMVCNLRNYQVTDKTVNFDRNATGLKWSSDDKKIYFISDNFGKDDIYELNLENDSIRTITQGIHNYTSVMVGNNELLATRMSMSAPTEIFSVSLDGRQKQISFINKDLLDQIKMGKVEERWLKASDGKDLHTWVIYPPDFDSTKKYPTLLYCEGGPQSTVSQFWSYRWNFQIMAANGYIIVAPNRRGLPGFGQEWNEAISGDYGGQCMRDYLTAIDEISKEPYVDTEHRGAVGASFGGFSVYWLAGHHNKRFKCFIAHNGMFNFEQQYLETEEMWFVNWDLGGPYWDKNNKIAQRSYANSPHLFVDKWDTPLLVIHSEYDYRIVASQGMAAYNAAVLRGIPARYLYFPDESHWVLKPQNGILWQRNFFDWLDKWLK